MEARPYQQDVEVIENVEISTDHYHLTLREDGRLSNEAKPGQFVNLSIPKRVDLLLRRPFSIAKVRAGQSLLEIVYRVVGKGTRAMVDLKPGDVVDLMGPLGRGFDIAEGEKNCLLLGGGCGVAPLWGLAETLFHKRNSLIALLGFQSSDRVFGEDIFRNCHAETIVTTDDGSYGLKGFLSDHLGKVLERKIDRVYLCGPAGMLKAVLPMIKRVHIKGEVSLEERMGCGYGVCLSCVADIRKDGVIEKQRVCTEGPVFDIEEVILGDDSGSCR
jgi:dihydroorotate dehydrogenase electron transfer subunit